LIQLGIGGCVHGVRLKTHVVSCEGEHVRINVVRRSIRVPELTVTDEDLSYDSRDWW